MGELNVEKVLDEISKIDSKEGIKMAVALLLNELMKKERELCLKESIDNKAKRQLACFLNPLGIPVDTSHSQ